VNARFFDSFTLFDQEGQQVPLQMVADIGEKFEYLLEEV
jgi:hypothetical protein